MATNADGDARRGSSHYTIAVTPAAGVACWRAGGAAADTARPVGDGDRSQVRHANAERRHAGSDAASNFGTSHTDGITDVTAPTFTVRSIRRLRPAIRFSCCSAVRRWRIR